MGSSPLLAELLGGSMVGGSAMYGGRARVGSVLLICSLLADGAIEDPLAGRPLVAWVAVGSARVANQ
jgi:hypothetical protein